MRGNAIILVGLLVGACASPSSSPTSPTVSTDPPASIVVASPAADCDTSVVVAMHQVPELEGLLPASVAGRSLARWSVRGPCWVQVVTGLPPADIDGYVARLESSDDPGRIDLAHLAYAVAGRSNTKNDPPFFVFGAARPQDGDELTVTLAFLLGGASFHDLDNAANLTNYDERTIAGKQVYEGTVDMLNQGEHQRGRPYIYQTDDYLFVVITDDDAWAADAIGQLP
jgi:hypothetical protein